VKLGLRNFVPVLGDPDAASRTPLVDQVVLAVVTNGVSVDALVNLTWRSSISILLAIFLLVSLKAILLKLIKSS